MPRLFATLALLTIATTVAATNASAQSFHLDWNHGGFNHGHHGEIHHDSGPHRSHRWGHDHHDDWHHDVHVPDVGLLDAYSDQLETIAQHLHDDAHKLSQDYEHSAAIEHLVDRIERLQKHMHQILHRSNERGFTSTSLVRHVKQDIHSVSSLVAQLDQQLSHQGEDGARTGDFHAIAHMRRIIATEMRPLIRQVNTQLHGVAAPVHVPAPIHAPVQPLVSPGTTIVPIHGRPTVHRPRIRQRHAASRFGF